MKTVHFYFRIECGGKHVSQARKKRIVLELMQTETLTVIMQVQYLREKILFNCIQLTESFYGLNLQRKALQLILVQIRMPDQRHSQSQKH